MTCPLTLGDRMTFLPLTETNPFNSLGYVKVSLQTDAPKCKSIIIKGEGTDNNQTQNKLVKNITGEILKTQLEEQDQSYQYLSSIGPSLQLQNIQLGKKRN